MIDYISFIFLSSVSSCFALQNQKLGVRAVISSELVVRDQEPAAMLNTTPPATMDARKIYALAQAEYGL